MYGELGLSSLERCNLCQDLFRRFQTDVFPLAACIFVSGFEHRALARLPCGTSCLLAFGNCRLERSSAQPYPTCLRGHVHEAVHGQSYHYAQ